MQILLSLLYKDINRADTKWADHDGPNQIFKGFVVMAKRNSSSLHASHIEEIKLLLLSSLLAQNTFSPDRSWMWWLKQVSVEMWTKQSHIFHCLAGPNPILSISFRVQGAALGLSRASMAAILDQFPPLLHWSGWCDWTGGRCCGQRSPQKPATLPLWVFSSDRFVRYSNKDDTFTSFWLMVYCKLFFKVPIATITWSWVWNMFYSAT